MKFRHRRCRLRGVGEVLAKVQVEASYQDDCVRLQARVINEANNDAWTHKSKQLWESI